MDVVDLYFHKLLAQSYDQEISLVIIKLKKVLSHPRFDIRYTLFHYKECMF